MPETLEITPVKLHELESLEGASVKDGSDTVDAEHADVIVPTSKPSKFLRTLKK